MSLRTSKSSRFSGSWQMVICHTEGFGRVSDVLFVIVKAVRGVKVSKMADEGVVGDGGHLGVASCRGPGYFGDLVNVPMSLCLLRNLDMQSMLYATMSTLLLRGSNAQLYSVS